MRAIAVCTIDPHMAVPTFIVNWVITTIADFFLPMLLSHSKVNPR